MSKFSDLIKSINNDYSREKVKGLIEKLKPGVNINEIYLSVTDDETDLRLIHFAITKNNVAFLKALLELIDKNKNKEEISGLLKEALETIQSNNLTCHQTITEYLLTDITDPTYIPAISAKQSRIFL